MDFWYLHLLTAGNLWFLSCWNVCSNRRRNTEDEQGVRRLNDNVQAVGFVSVYFLQLAEGIFLILLVDDSMENSVLLTYLLFGVVAAVSSFLLRKNSWVGALGNLLLEGVLTLVTVKYFIEPTTQNVAIFACLAANEAMAGVVVRLRSQRIDASSSTDDDDGEEKIFGKEVGLMLLEAAGDVLLPFGLAWLQSQFSPNSYWRAEWIKIWWLVVPFVSVTALVGFQLPPLKGNGQGKALVSWVAVLLFVVCTVLNVWLGTRTIIDQEKDPSVFDISWSWGLMSVSILMCCGCCAYMSEVTDWLLGF